MTPPDSEIRAYFEAQGWTIESRWPSGRITLSKGRILCRCESAEKAYEILRAREKRDCEKLKEALGILQKTGSSFL